MAKDFNAPEGSTGALVGDVTPKSPAEKAGFKNGDIITEFNGKPVKDARHLRLQVAGTPPGTKVPVKIIRDGETKTLEVVLKEYPKDEELAKRDQGGDNESSSSETLNGVTVSDIDAQSRRDLRLPANLKGALVVQIEEGSAAGEAGLREGDVIVEINRRPVRSADDAVTLSDKIKDKHILLRVWSGGVTRYIPVDESKEKEKAR